MSFVKFKSGSEQNIRAVNLSAIVGYTVNDNTINFIKNGYSEIIKLSNNPMPYGDGLYHEVDSDMFLQLAATLSQYEFEKHNFAVFKLVDSSYCAINLDLIKEYTIYKNHIMFISGDVIWNIGNKDTPNDLIGSVHIIDDEQFKPMLEYFIS